MPHTALRWRFLSLGLFFFFAALVTCAEEGRLACAELFTCRSVGEFELPHGVDHEIPDRIGWSTQFHALAGQRELHALATRLAGAMSASLQKGGVSATEIAAAARDAMVARRDQCRAEMVTADIVAACNRPRKDIVLALATHPEQERIRTPSTLHYVLPRDGSSADWDVRCAAASRAAAAAGFAVPDPLFWPNASHQVSYPTEGRSGPLFWYDDKSGDIGSEGYPPDAPERFVFRPAVLGRPRDGAALCGLARRSLDGDDTTATALLDGNAAMRRRIKAQRKAYLELVLGRGAQLWCERNSTRPMSRRLHLYTLIFYPAGRHGLGQFFAYYRDRVPDVTFTVVDMSNGTSRADDRDGRMALATAYDAEVLSGHIDPSRWAIIRNELWKRHRGSAAPAWVGFIDTDEFLDVDTRMLDLWQMADIGAVRAVGFQMVGLSRDYHRVTRGFRDKLFNKLVLWRPDGLDDVHTGPGNHDAQPEPAEWIKVAATDLYHYKYAAPDQYAYSDNTFSWDDSDCKSALEAAAWAAFDDVAGEIFGESGLRGMAPCREAYARLGGVEESCDEEYDRDATLRLAATTNATCVGYIADWLVKFGPNRTFGPFNTSGVAAHDARKWAWSLNTAGARAEPPYLKAPGVVDDAAWRAPELTATVAVMTRAAAGGEGDFDFLDIPM